VATETGLPGEGGGELAAHVSLGEGEQNTGSIVWPDSKLFFSLPNKKVDHKKRIKVDKSRLRDSTEQTSCKPGAAC